MPRYRWHEFELIISLPNAFFPSLTNCRDCCATCFFLKKYVELYANQRVLACYANEGSAFRSDEPQSVHLLEHHTVLRSSDDEMVLIRRTAAAKRLSAAVRAARDAAASDASSTSATTSVLADDGVSMIRIQKKDQPKAISEWFELVRLCACLVSAGFGVCKQRSFLSSNFCQTKMAHLHTHDCSQLRKASLQSARRIFGVPLDELLRREGRKAVVPQLVHSCVSWLRRLDPLPPALFEQQGSPQLLSLLRSQADAGAPLEFDVLDSADALAVAALLLEFLREMPEPPVPFALCSSLCTTLDQRKLASAEIDNAFVSVLERMPPQNADLLRFLCDFLRYFVFYFSFDFVL